MAISLNYTSFSALGTQIVNAMTTALASGESVRMINRKGEPWLLIQIIRDTLGYRFAFVDTDGREVGDMVLKAAIRVWADDVAAQFWSIQAQSYDLHEHPLVTRARKDHEERVAAHLIADVRARGATHKVIGYGGAVLGYGGYQRDWLGRKRIYLIADGKGKAYAKAVKMAKEAALMVARMEAL